MSALAAAVSRPSRLDFERDGAHWPHRGHSRFVDAGGLRWHVQIMGDGPAVVLLHGAGAASHSWRGVAPLLAARFTVIAPDLPGHGFSTPAPDARLSLPGMAGGVRALLGALDVAPALLVGHSAGAAVAARLCLDGAVAPHALVSVNGALMPFRGIAGHLFAPAARLLSRGSLVPRLVARAAAAPGAVERLIRDTGSTLDAEGVRLYRVLVRNPGHVAATLTMMARWDLDALARDLPRLDVPLTLVVGARDRTVPPADAQRVRALLPDAEIVRLDGLGHLAHEERPGEVVEIVARAARRAP